MISVFGSTKLKFTSGDNVFKVTFENVKTIEFIQTHETYSPLCTVTLHDGQVLEGVFLTNVWDMTPVAMDG